MSNIAIWADFIGYFGLLISVSSYLMIKPYMTVRLQTASAGIYALHFIGMGSITASVVPIAALLRNLGLIFMPDKSDKFFIGGYLLMIWGLNFYLAKGTWDFLPSIMGTCAAVGMFHREKFWHFRLCFLASQSICLIYMLQIGSTPGLYCGATAIAVNSVTMLNYFLHEHITSHSIMAEHLPNIEKTATEQEQEPLTTTITQTAEKVVEQVIPAIITTAVPVVSQAKKIKVQTATITSNIKPHSPTVQ